MMTDWVCSENTRGEGQYESGRVRGAGRGTDWVKGVRWVRERC